MNTALLLTCALLAADTAARQSDGTGCTDEKPAQVDAIKLEKVSPRLKATLVHSKPAGRSLTGVRFSPDGKQLVAVDYPGGVIELWAVASGERLTTIESGHDGGRSSEYFFVSPDWKMVYVPVTRRKAIKVNKNGRPINLWVFDGGIQAWNLATGELQDVYKQTPARGIEWVAMSLDGSTLMVMEEQSGEAEDRPEGAASLFDIKSKRWLEVDARQTHFGTFSSDNKTIAIPNAVDDYWTSTAVRLYDVETGELQRSLPIPDPFARSGTRIFTPDRKQFIGSYTSYADGDFQKDGRSHLKFWDLTTGNEAATFAWNEDEPQLGMFTLSPDGATLAATTWKGGPCRLYLFNTKETKQTATMLLWPENALNNGPVFSRDGKWIAVVSRVIPERLRGREGLVEQYPQPRIHPD